MVTYEPASESGSFSFEYEIVNTSIGLFSTTETVFLDVLALGDCLSDVLDCEFGRSQ